MRVCFGGGAGVSSVTAGATLSRTFMDALAVEREYLLVLGPVTGRASVTQRSRLIRSSCASPLLISLSPLNPPRPSRTTAAPQLASRKAVVHEYGLSRTPAVATRANREKGQCRHTETDNKN